MAMSALPQSVIASPGCSVVLKRDARPVMNGALQPSVAGQAADHEALLAALPRHRRNPCQGAQGVVVSSAQRLGGLDEQCGENDPADSRPGAKDRHVTLLGVLPRGALLFFELGAQAVQALLRLLDLLIDQVQTGREAADMYARGLCRAWRHEQWCLAQGLEHRRRIEAADTISAEDACDRLLAGLGEGVRKNV